ncbi:MAG: hypothetical protein GY757_43690, partial [bacterium]|nr:hypothetical protein [bacterium]
LTCMKDSRFINYTVNDGLPDDRVRTIFKDQKDDLWITTAAGIVKLLKPGVFQVYAPEKELPHFKTSSLVKEDTHELWIGTGDSGLFRWGEAGIAQYGIEAGIPHPTITCLYEDKKRNLWIGSDGGGLTRITPKSPGSEKEKISSLSTKDGLADGYVYSIYEGKEGCLWVGTLDGGLHQITDSKFTAYTTREGLVNDYLNCIHEDRKGNLWFGTKEGLSRLTKDTGNVDRFLITGKGLKEIVAHKRGPDIAPLTSKQDNTVMCLLEIRKDEEQLSSSTDLYIGTMTGLHILKNGSLSSLTKKDGLSDNRINCIYEDRRGSTWIGTENGLNRLESSGNITRFTPKEGLSDKVVLFIIKAPPNFHAANSPGTPGTTGTPSPILVGTNAGLTIIDNKNITVEKRNRSFRCAFIDKEGVPWFGTNSGLIRGLGKKSTSYTLQNGLIENYVYSILEDRKGYLWLGGRNGISRVLKKELEDFAAGKINRLQPDWFNEKDGMKSRWCTGAGCETKDGRFWFPTGMGAAMIAPNHIEINNHRPYPIINKVVVDDVPVNLQEGPLNCKPDEKRLDGPLEMEPGKKRLEFLYTAASFINPRKMKFKIKLDGYDNRWMEMENVRSATYTGLTPGHYTFKVATCNNDGVWSKRAAEFSFYLKPYFYQTPWFYTLLVLTVILAVLFLFRLRFKQLKTRERELGLLVDERTSDLKERNLELETAQRKIRHSKELIEAKSLQLEEQSEKLKEMDKMKSRFFANISHEFRTPLTLIMGPLEQMIAAPGDDGQKKRLNLMLRNSERLLGLINQLLELSKFESGKMKLQAAPKNVIPILKGITANFEPLTERYELDLAFRGEEKNITLYIDAGKLENIISNLLINAAKFTPAGGKITVMVKSIPGQKSMFPDGALRISVADTGPGIPGEQLEHIFDRFYQAESTYEHREKGTGIGLALVKELVQLHHGKIDVYSREGKGTEFIITLPMGDAHLAPGEITEPGLPADDKPG